MLGKGENQTDKRTNSGKKKNKTTGDRGKEKGKDLRQLKKKKSHDLPPGRRSGIMPEGKEKTKSKQ